MRPFRADIAGLIEAGLAMATTDMTVNLQGPEAGRFDLERTPLADVLRQRYQTAP